MLVKHLIEELKKCDPEGEVMTEGCDCDGDSAFLERDYYEDGSNAVYIHRSNVPKKKYDNRTILKPLDPPPVA